MLKIGITGGIGSGKSVVAQVFGILGIPVLDADAFAKKIMETDISVREKLINTFGEAVFANNVLQRQHLASIVFNQKEKLKQLNDIVHPTVAAKGLEWMEKQDAPYVIKEAALFFESGSHTQMDKMIGVHAPYEIRLQRAMQRDSATKEAIEKRMAGQMDEEEKMKKCDFVILNDEQNSIIKQVLDLHQQFLNPNFKQHQ